MWKYDSCVVVNYDSSDGIAVLQMQDACNAWVSCALRRVECQVPATLNLSFWLYTQATWQLA